MRVIGGRLRGRALRGPSGEVARRLRPTRDRVREALFNILRHGNLGDPGDPGGGGDRAAPAGMRVLDLFAGTGALGIEALSRDAAWCTFIDTDPEARALIRANLETLGLIGRARVWRRDACRLARYHGPAFDLVFADPPYGSDATLAAIDSAVAGGWLAPDALAVLETPARDAPAPPAGWTAVARRRYGATGLAVLRRDAGAAGDRGPA